MGDVLNRDEKEAELARILAREFNRVRLELLKLIPALDRFLYDVAPEFWQEHRTNLLGSLAPAMTGIFLTQAQNMLDDFAFIGVEWGVVNQAAADWAKTYTFDLVRGITDTSQATLQKLIPQFFESQWTQGQLREQLAPLFGAVRAEMIARTEVTRAAVEGEVSLVRELQGQGIAMTPKWQTRMDEIVCPICGPKADKPIEDGVYPPAHPRCRCWVTHELPED